MLICFILFQTGFYKFINYRGRRCRIRTSRRFVLQLGKKKIPVRNRTVYRKIGFFWKPSARKPRRFYRVKVRRGRWLVRILGKTRRLIRRKGRWFFRQFRRLKRLSRVRFVFSWARKRLPLKVLRRGQMIVRLNNKWVQLRSLKSKHIFFNRRKLTLARAKKNFYSVKIRKGKLSRPLRVVRIKKGKHDEMNNLTSRRVLASREGTLLE